MSSIKSGNIAFQLAGYFTRIGKTEHHYTQVDEERKTQPNVFALFLMNMNMDMDFAGTNVGKFLDLAAGLGLTNEQVEKMTHAEFRALGESLRPKTSTELLEAGPADDSGKTPPEYKVDQDEQASDQSSPSTPNAST